LEFCAAILVLLSAAPSFSLHRAFVVAPPLPSLSRRRSPHHRAAGSAFVVAPPVVLLPLVVIMPPVEVVVHSVALLPLAAVVLRRRAARRRRVPPVAIVVPPIEVRSLHRRPAGSAFVVAPPLSSLLRKRCLPCGAAAAFIVAPPLPSSSPPLIVAWFCLRCRAAAAFLVAPPLPPSTTVAVVYRPSPLSCRPSKLIVESSGPLVAVVVPHVALTSAATRRPPFLVADC
jgi:hypothetical protein